jgi:hypothetical protein
MKEYGRVKVCSVHFNLNSELRRLLTFISRQIYFLENSPGNHLIGSRADPSTDTSVVGKKERKKEKKERKKWKRISHLFNT